MMSGILFLAIWVVVKIMVPFGVPDIVRHLLFRVPKKRDHNFDHHPYGSSEHKGPAKMEP